MNRKGQEQADGLAFIIDGSDVSVKGDSSLEPLDGYTIGEGMALLGERRGPLFLANTVTKCVRQLVDENGHVVGFEDSDFDWEKLERVEHRRCLDDMVAMYSGLSRWTDYQDGLCIFSWMLYPDGRFFADEDGYGMKDNDEERIFCIIDTQLRVIIPFQPMSDEDRAACMRKARGLVSLRPAEP